MAEHRTVWTATLGGIRYAFDNERMTMSIVERPRKQKRPETAADSERLRKAELKRRRKGMKRLEERGLP